MKQPDRFPKAVKRNFAQPSILVALAMLLGSNNLVMASVIDSKHNLSATGPGPVKAVSETQVCVFCHTPHGGDQTAGAPLWNRLLSTVTYTPYLSSSTDADQPPGQPGASSKVCLSCHDGTLAIGVVGNLNSRKANIAMEGTTNGKMPDGTIPGTGFTSNLGIDLSYDHPISFIYSATLPTAVSNVVVNDGELRPPPVTDGSDTIVGNRGFGVKPTFPLEDDQMQCPTCHDPHLSTSNSPKFLRGLLLQQTTSPTGGLFSPTKDLMCLACHDKDKAGPTTWSQSVHAYNDVDVANEAYTDSAADLREFPRGTKVWQASCVNCHDTHTVPGARHLLREATDSSNTPKTGGLSALEENCYQCHSDTSDLSNVLDPNSPPNIVPDIKSDFLLPYRMPIAAQPETHDIGGNFDDSSGVSGGLATAGTGGSCKPGDQCGKDFVESEALLGRASAGGVIDNRHTECTDCHNPHRTIKNRLFNANPITPDAAGTHQHNIEATNLVAHSNIASGSLRGTFGVEPVYDSAEFGTPGIPLSFDVKRGDPGLEVKYDIATTTPYVTREYQICLKCHSNYAYDDNTPPLLGYTGGTPQYIVNGFDTYLNTAMEFQAPFNHKGAPLSTTDSGADSAFSADNYRSWHPVIDNTGRDVTLRGNASLNLWRAPWNGSDMDGGGSIFIDSAVDRAGNTYPVTTGAVGNQTMYCSDCHGTFNNVDNGVVPEGNGSPGSWTEDGKPWGPHGSTQPFILKGPWDTTAPITPATDVLCFRCHDATQYADATGSPATVLQSGFSAASGVDAVGATMTNLHQRHAYYTSTAGRLAYPSSVWPSGADNTYRCTMCHTGTAHGWKNKDFLVNLNDVGPEVDRAINGTAGGALGGEVAPGPVILTTGQNVPKGTQVPAGMAPVPTGYTNGPYYQGALLYLNGFKTSGNWTKADCANSGCH
jgi:hypothetical protein